MSTPAGDPDLTGRVRLDLTNLISGLRFAQAVTRRQIGRLVDDANRRLNGLDSGRLTAGLGRVAGMIGSLGRLAVPFAAAGAAVGALVPLVAGLVATLANVAPAAALGVSALIALQLATGTLKLAMVGVGDAVSAALDPEGAEAYAEAIKKLSPEARKFTDTLRSMAPELDTLRRQVQDRVFAGFNTELKTTATAVLPALKRALLDTSTTLNAMGKGVAAAARDLGDRGILGTALKGATGGLKAFQRVPGQIVTALGQIGAAAAPSFQRLAEAGGSAADRLFEKLSRAFETGAMQDAIEQAIDLIGQLGDVAGNIGQILGAIFGAASASGGGFLGVLEDVTAEIARVAQTDEVQSALRALFDVMATAGKTIAPLLGQALRALAPVFTALGPPVEILIEALGGALGPVIKALGPVLLAAARAVGQLIVSLSPLLPVLGELVAALLPALTPLLDAATQIFAALAPVVQQVATIMRESLGPQLAALTPLVKPLAELIANQLVFWLGFLGDLLVELSPSLISLGDSFAKLMVACAPLIQIVADLSAELLEQLAPHLPGLIAIVGQLAAILARVLASNITTVVIPALRLLAQLLRGDFSGAFDTAKRMSLDMTNKVVETLRNLPGRARSALTNLAPFVVGRALEMGNRFVSSIRTKLDEAIARVAALPSRAVASLGPLGSVLFRAGASLISGFISGIRSMIPSLSGVLGGITNNLPNWKGPAERDATILTESGQLVMQGFMAGIDSATGRLRAQLGQITSSLPGLVGGMSSALGSVPRAGQVAYSTAPAAAGGGHTFNLYGSDASPDGILRALSWRGLVGGTSG